MTELFNNVHPHLSEFCESCSTHYPHWSLKYQDLDIWQCQECKSLSYIIPNKFDPTSLYTESYFKNGEYKDYQAHWRTHEANARRKLMILSRLQKGPLRIFELGCAYGFFLKTAKEAGIEQIFGIDPSEDAIKAATETIGPYFGDLNQSPDFSYNCLVAWDVWEHLDSPISVFRKHLLKLESRGIVALTTVNSASLVARIRGRNWRQIHPPTHIHYPTAKALQKTFQNLGCDIIYQKSFSPLRAIETYTTALGIDWPRSELKYLNFSVNLFDTQFLVARKL